MAATEQDRAGRNRSAFEDLLLLLTSAFSPLFFPQLTQGLSFTYAPLSLARDSSVS